MGDRAEGEQRMPQSSMEWKSMGIKLPTIMEYSISEDGRVKSAESEVAGR